jgi:bacterioferritin
LQAPAVRGYLARETRETRKEREMGTRGREIVGLDVKELLVELNRALSDEWLAHYQYWVGSKVVMGPMKDAAIAELVQHAADEMRHAEMLSLRIVQLGGAPVLSPQEWYGLTHCGYEAPADPFIQKVLEQNIKGEQCAIGAYDQLARMTFQKDMVTYNMAQAILSDEVEHEEDLQALLEDYDAMMQRARAQN